MFLLKVAASILNVVSFIVLKSPKFKSEFSLNLSVYCHLTLLNKNLSNPLSSILTGPSVPFVFVNFTSFCSFVLTTPFSISPDVTLIFTSLFNVSFL